MLRRATVSGLLTVLVLGSGSTLASAEAWDPATDSPSYELRAPAVREGRPQVLSEAFCGEFQIVGSGGQPVTPDILEQTRTIIENRVNAFGVAGPIVLTQGQDRVSVELPGIEDGGEVADELRRLIGTVGVLEFLPVPPEFFDRVDRGLPLPEGMADVEPLFTGVEIANARLGRDLTNGEIVVDVELKETGARIFDAFAAEHLGDQFAIVLDGIVTTAPTINAERFDGQAQISGGFTQDEANALVTVLRFGSLPLEIREVEFEACPSASE